MKFYECKISKSLSMTMGIFLSFTLYLIIVIFLSLLTTYINPSGEAYNSAFGIAQFIGITLYWILINYFFFSAKGETSPKCTILYIVLNSLPIFIFTVATIVLTMYYPSTDFFVSWNLLTWIVGPTLFWYIPYSYLYIAFQAYLTVPMFIAFAFVYQTVIQVMGIVLGLARRSYASEKLKKKAKKEPKRRIHTRRTARSFDEVVADEPEEEKIIYTESFEIIKEQDLVQNDLPTEVINREIDRIASPESDELTPKDGDA